MNLIGGFEWDGGNLEKCQRHGVTISRIEEAFRGSIDVAPDLAHSGKEVWFRAAYRTAEGRAVFLVFTLRRRAGKVLVRPISARFMHEREIDSYEETRARVRER